MNDQERPILHRLRAEIRERISNLQRLQEDDGSWRLPFETGPMTDAYMIILLTVMEMEDELVVPLVQRLKNRQSISGAWQLHDDDEGHLSSTVEAYTALLLSGYGERSDPMMKRAEAYIVAHGGVEGAHISTKFMLALNGLYPWPAVYPVPLYLIQLPRFSPLSFHRWSSYVRSHFASILILGYHKFSISPSSDMNLFHLFVTDKYEKLRRRHRKKQTPGSEKMGHGHRSYAKAALQKAEQYIIQNIEEDGSQYSYASSTFFMIYALLAAGYKRESPIIQQAVDGLKSFSCLISADEPELHIQNSPSTVWDTALISYVMQEAGVDPQDVAVSRAIRYLLPLQLPRGIMPNQRSSYPGGWGFSESNSVNPDVDDTQAVLRALSRLSGQGDGVCRRAWRSGVQYLFHMQNKDGGWAAFEKNSTAAVVRLFRIPNFVDTAADPSCADITGRVMEFLGSHMGLSLSHSRVQDAVSWLLKQQNRDGSWYGRWGVSYIYGTWAAVTGLRAAGIHPDHPAIQKAVNWLWSIRQPDGGWGESCASDVLRRYKPAPYSTVVHTAWALDTLISVYNYPVQEMDDSIKNLIEWGRAGDQRSTYPTGAGLPGHFYIYYHSYPRVWPLLTMSHYVKKYN